MNQQVIECGNSDHLTPGIVIRLFSNINPVH
jgi:hypothetical protein